MKFIVCNNTKNKELIALSAKEANTKASTTKWQQIAVIGKWKGHVNGPFELTTKDLDQIVANFKNAKAGDVVVDFEHQTLSGEKAEATGWVKDLKVDTNSLFAKIEWLEDTKALIKNKKYKYLSPVLNPYTIEQTSGEDIGWSLHSVALTNKPFFEELDEVKINKNQSKIKEIKVGEKKLKELEDKLDIANARVKELEGENQKLKDENADTKKVAAKAKITEAVAARRVQPDQADSLLAFSQSDPEGFDKFLASAKTINAAPGADDMFVNSQQQNIQNSDDKLSEDELKA